MSEERVMFRDLARELADEMWDRLPERTKQAHNGDDWRDGFSDGVQVCMLRMEHRGLSDRKIRDLLGMR